MKVTVQVVAIGPQVYVLAQTSRRTVVVQGDPSRVVRVHDGRK
jgi:hypothetical protein